MPRGRMTIKICLDDPDTFGPGPEEFVDVTVQYCRIQGSSEYIATDKGKFTRSILHSISSPYGWQKVESIPLE